MADKRRIEPFWAISQRHIGRLMRNLDGDEETFDDTGDLTKDFCQMTILGIEIGIVDRNRIKNFPRVFLGFLEFSYLHIFAADIWR